MIFKYFVIRQNKPFKLGTQDNRNFKIQNKFDNLKSKQKESWMVIFVMLTIHYGLA